MAKETWETSSMVKAWQENEDAPTWEVFTDALIAHPHCPENYTEHTHPAAGELAQVSVR